MVLWSLSDCKPLKENLLLANPTEVNIESSSNFMIFKEIKNGFEL